MSRAPFPTESKYGRDFWVGLSLLLGSGFVFVCLLWASAEGDDIAWAYLFWVPLIVAPAAFMAMITACALLWRALAETPPRK